MLETLKLASFEPHVGSAFQLRSEDGRTLALKLSEAAGVGGDPSPDREPFALLFTGPDEPALEQGIYPLEHEGLGTLELFLVPLGPGPEGGMRYEAVFT